MATPERSVSTHTTQCVVCGKDVYCCEDVHALGIGGKRGEGGCSNPPFIEFCSLAHAIELLGRLTGAIANYHRVCGNHQWDQVFGFTRGDVGFWLLSLPVNRPGVEERIGWDQLRSIADQIEALLPPRDDGK